MNLNRVEIALLTKAERGPVTLDNSMAIAKAARNLKLHRLILRIGHRLYEITPAGRATLERTK